MQLRVARLCLDCEELHADNRCPRCASEHYAFLSNWLPSAERRRWRRPSPRLSVNRERGVAAVAHAIARWFRGEPELPPHGPVTRRSDDVAQMNFEEPADQASKTPAVEALLSKREGH